MTVITPTTNFAGETQLYAAGSSTDDNEIILETSDIRRFDTFMLMTTAGAVDVFPSVDGDNFATAPLSLVDLGAETLSPVLVSAENRIFGFCGRYSKLRFRQNGVTDVTAFSLMCSRMGY